MRAHTRIVDQVGTRITNVIERISHSYRFLQEQNILFWFESWQLSIIEKTALLFEE